MSEENKIWEKIPDESVRLVFVCPTCKREQALSVKEFLKIWEPVCVHGNPEKPILSDLMKLDHIESVAKVQTGK
jgi:hypothetical protein